MNETRLDAGEEARVGVGNQVVKRTASDPAKSVAWRQRRLVFDREPLPGMIGEFNRYNEAPQFQLQDANVANRHYTGVFDADDPESLVQLLSAEPDLVLERHEDKIIIRSR